MNWNDIIVWAEMSGLHLLIFYTVAACVLVGLMYAAEAVIGRWTR